MAHGGLQALGLGVALLGWGALVAATALPQWETLSLVGGTIITAVGISQGLWMTCSSQSTGQLQCKAYDSLLALPGPLQAARALMVVSVVLCPLALGLAVAGMKCTRCGEEQPRRKAQLAAFAGGLFLLAGLAGLIACSWYGHRIISNFYDPLVPVNYKFELGPAIFVGWAGSALALLGGDAGLLLPPKQSRARAYPPTRPPRPGPPPAAASTSEGEPPPTGDHKHRCGTPNPPTVDARP